MNRLLYNHWKLFPYKLSCKLIYPFFLSKIFNKVSNTILFGGDNDEEELVVNKIKNHIIKIPYKIKVVISQSDSSEFENVSKLKSDKKEKLTVISFLSIMAETCLTIIKLNNNKFLIYSVIRKTKCFNLRYSKQDELLIKTAIHFLKKYYKKGKIIIRDVSFNDDKCDDINILSRSHTLLYGITWYMKLGFTPHENNDKLKAKENFNIMNSVLIKDHYKFIFKILKKKISNSDYLSIKKLYQTIIKTDSSQLLKEFLKSIRKFDVCIFNYLIEPLYTKLKLHDLYDKLFEYNIT